MNRSHGIGRRIRVVGDHDDRLPELPVQLLQHAQHELGVRRIQIAGRLIGKQDSGAVDDRACQSNSLLLAPRELARSVRALSLETQKPQQLLAEGAISGVPRISTGVNPLRQLEIFLDAQRRKEIEPLEDEPDFPNAADPSSWNRSGVAISSPRTKSFPPVGERSPPIMWRSVDFPEPDLPGDRDELSLENFQVDRA